MRRSTARALVARLDALLEELTVSPEASCLTQLQLETMLSMVVTRHLAKLERVAAAAKSFPDFNFNQSRADDRRVMWAYTLFDAQGWTAVVRADDRKNMLADGLTEADIGAVQDHLTMLRVHELVPTKPHILSELIETAGAPPTAMNLAQAQSVYFQGMKLALAQSERRFGAVRVEEADFIEGVLKNRAIAPSVAPLVKRSSAPVQNPQAAKQSETDETNPTQSAVPIEEITSFAETIIRKKNADEEWDAKTQRQARSITSLLVKYLRQESKIVDLDKLRQSHLSDFIEFLSSTLPILARL